MWLFGVGFVVEGVVDFVALHLEFAVADGEEADGGAFGCAVDVAEVGTVGAFECHDAAGEVLTVVVGIPGGTVDVVVVAFHGVGIGLAVDDEDLEGKGYLCSVAVFADAGLPGTLELDDAVGVAVVVLHEQAAGGLHLVLLLELHDDLGGEGLHGVVVAVEVDELVVAEVVVGDDDPHAPHFVFRQHVAGVGEGVVQARGRYGGTAVEFAGVDVAAFGILEGLAKVFEDAGFAGGCDEVGVLRGVLAEVLLQLPTLVLGFVVVGALIVQHRFFHIAPVDHLHVVLVEDVEEHGGVLTA